MTANEIRPQPPGEQPLPSLEDQIVVVTGASSGIGRGIALMAARAGADVVVNFHSQPEPAEIAAEEIRAAGRRALTVQADVSDEGDVEAMFARAVEAFGTVDVLVANAGLQRDAPTHEMSLDDWRTVIDVNLTGQFLCARAAIREFLRRGVRPVSVARGKIVQVSSVHEIVPWAGRVNYAASKAGVAMMVRSLAQEYAPMGIRVNSLAPGAIRTPINKEAWEHREAYEALMQVVPYRRIGEVEDAARAAVWLASDASDYVNGTTLVVDGGMTTYPAFRDGG